MNETKTIESNFEYSYSAKRQREVEEIRKKYLPKEEIQPIIKLLFSSLYSKQRAISLSIMWWAKAAPIT